MMPVQKRVEQLQKLLAEHQLDAYVVPSGDPHQSEYVAEAWKRREFISGFSGSSGLFACTKNEAGLWTDGRYFVQAEAELKDSGVRLFRQGQAGVPDWKSWMAQTLRPGARLGINLELFSWASYEALEKELEAARTGIVLVPQEQDLVDRVWAEDRPAFHHAPLRAHPLELAGVAAEEKIAALRAEMQRVGAGALIVSALDEIAWLFNLRGADVTFNPVFYAFAWITAKEARLFVHPEQSPASLKAHWGDRLQFSPYASFMSSLSQLQTLGKVWLDPNSSSAALAARLDSLGISLLFQRSPLPAWKAVKNAAELSGMRAAHVRDGVAVFRLILWLREALARGERPSEISVSEVLDKLRARSSLFLGPSFATIAGYGPHGALPHYRATRESNANLEPQGIFLLDSGGQYTDGTTDITRTLSLGHPTAEEKHVYTSVLRGHLLLGRSLFPAGVNGYQLDVLARQPLWAVQADYNHGTGHGVGAALCVHEGPFGVSMRQNLVPLAVGHILSNEPGWYLEGRFGVRIENLVTVVPRSEKQSSFGNFLGFEDLTLCPYDRSLIDVTRLSPEDRAQVDAYHSLVYAQLAPHLEAHEQKELALATAALKA